MTWQITLNHVCAVLYDISLLAQAYRCMQMVLQTLLFKAAAWHGTFDMIISHLSDLTSPSSDRRCQWRWEMMATLNTNLDKLLRNAETQTADWNEHSAKDLHRGKLSQHFCTPLISFTEIVWSFFKSVVNTLSALTIVSVYGVSKKELQYFSTQWLMASQTKVYLT